jgi:hypothetical protein
VRTSTNAQFDRLVFDLGPNPVDASAIRGDRYVVELQASPPSLDLGTQGKLSKLGVKIEKASSGTRVDVDRRGREVRVFKLAGASNSGDRIVLDIAKAGTSSLPIPPDAGRVPERTQSASAMGSSMGGGSAPVLGGGSSSSGGKVVLGGGSSSSGGKVVLGGGSPAPTGGKVVLGGGSPAPTGGKVVLGGGSPAPTGGKVVLGGGSSAPTSGKVVLGETPSVATGTRSPSRGGSAGGEEVWVSVRAIDFEGVAGEAPSRDDLLNLELNVSVADNGDLVAPRTDLPVQTVTLRGLTSDERRQSRIGGSLLQQIVERIADEYEERGKYGTRIDISKRDLERLINDQDGRLVIKISEAADAGSGSGSGVSG